MKKITHLIENDKVINIMTSVVKKDIILFGSV